MARGVEVFPRAQEYHVWLRLVVEVQPNRALRLNDGAIPDRENQFTRGASHTCGVAMTDGRHCHDLAVDELQPVVPGQDAGLTHALILVSREAFPDDRWRHGGVSIVAIGASAMPNRNPRRR